MAITPQTLGGMKARIAREIARSGMSQQIEDAINDAILIYQKERFKFNEAKPFTPVTFNTVAAQPYYLLSAIAGIGQNGLFHVDYINLTIGSTVTELDREIPENIRLLNMAGTQSGQPEEYAIEGETILISPIPSQAYALTIGGHFAVAAPASDDEASNPWMVSAERLIRSRAKYEIATHVTRNTAMAAQLSPDPPNKNGGVMGATYREFQALKGENFRLNRRGVIRPTQF